MRLLVLVVLNQQIEVLDDVLLIGLAHRVSECLGKSTFSSGLAD